LLLRLLVLSLLAVTLYGCRTNEMATTASFYSVQSSESQLCQINRHSMQAAFDASVLSTGAIGGVAIVKTPQGTFKLQTGMRGKGQVDPPTTDDYFRVGSVTKTMVATAILQLAQEQKIQLSDFVSHYRSDVPNGDKITIEQLLSMRSGLFSFSNAPEVGLSIDRDPSTIWTPEQLLSTAFQHAPTSEPGLKFDYSNTNTVILGTIIEKLDGKSLSQALKDRLFIPLGMNHTLYPEIDVNTLPNPHSQGYLYGAAAGFLRDAPLPASLQADIKAGIARPANVTNTNPSWTGAAGAVISTAEDLAIWVEALVTGKLLNAEYHQKWLNSSTPISNSPVIGYGMGHFAITTSVGSKLYGHFGLTPGFNTWMFHDPINQVTIVSWANLCPNSGTNAFFKALSTQIYPAISVKR